MNSDLLAPGLIPGPSVEDILAGADTTEFRRLVGNDSALQLFNYWSRLLREHGLAMKQQFDPLEVPALLSNIYIEEWDPEERQSRMRLMGEDLKAVWNEDVIGLRTDDFVRGDVNALWKQSDRIVYFENRTAILAYNMEYLDRPHCVLRDLTLPMQDHQGNRFAIGYIWQEH
ncbi:PAS domain-containing protein [Pelagibius sp. CAU 1746]|uniref:PAS domain-containing protein n=1 Tax=Pelagibius sp. CAU 1746 TaxID=3140370 RepID=UPI00325AFCAF